MKSLQFLGLVAVVAVTLHGQQYWSATVPSCASFDGSVSLDGPIAITDSSGATLGYSCSVSGTFLWLAAGGTWGTSIRVAAPSAGTVGVDYLFYDSGGNNLTLDSTSGTGLFPASGNEVNFALNANQASEVRLLGATSEAPHYNTTQTGSVRATFYCPDATTCETVLPQLVYSFTPIKPWSLSVPISWDFFFSPIQPQGAWPQWSATGVNDATHFVSLVIYNQDTAATSYTVRVYDSSGSLVGTGTTPSIPPVPVHSDGTFGEGGTYGALLSQVITTPLPTGVFKVLIDGGSNYSAVAVLQFNGDSATSLQVAYDSAPNTSSAALTTMRSSARPTRVPPRPRRVFAGLPK